LLRSNTHNTLHSSYGLALGFVAARERDDILLLTAVGQINHGGPQAVIDEEQAVVVANLNLGAGKKAMNMSDFYSAHSLFNHGISYLRRGHWNKHYDLSLELFNLAAKCALMNAEHDSLKMLTEQIMHNARCFEDKLQAISVTVTLQCWSGNVTASVELTNSTLSSLNEELPSVVTSATIKQYVDNKKAQLATLSDDTLLNYPAMVIPSKILAVELLVKLQVSLAIIGEGAAMTIIPLKVIQMSLTYGMSSYSPSAFAQYGNYLALIGDDFGEGCRYVKFALSLMKKVPSRAHDGITMFYSNHTKLHVEPMQSSIECYVDARKACLKSGIPFALSCSYTYNNLCLWSGKELNAVVVSMRDMIRESKYLKNFAILTIVLPMFRFAMRLMGQSDASAPQQDEDGNAGKYGFHLHDMFFTKLSEAYIFRELNKARDAAEKYFSIYCTQTNTMRWCVLRRLSPPATFFGRL
jgi:predicted ATPase